MYMQYIIESYIIKRLLNIITGIKHLQTSQKRGNPGTCLACFTAWNPVGVTQVCRSLTVKVTPQANVATNHPKQIQAIQYTILLADR